MKLLLYCTKGKPYLQVNRCVLPTEYDRYILDKKQYYSPFGEPLEKLNGKIVAKCDFEVEDINYRSAKFVCNRYYLEILKKSCLTDKQMYDYLNGKNGYAIHIKNLHIFDEPKELDGYSDYFLCDKDGTNRWEQIRKAPQNMCRVFDIENNKYILISIRPEWLCKILNGEKTIEVRKKVLKEMIK